MKDKIFPTPLGWSGIAASDKGIVRIVLPKKSKKSVERELRGSESEVRGVRGSEKKAEHLLARAVLLLQKYFSGAAVRLDVRVDLRSYTAFQQAVWEAAAGIPFGETRSYAWIAKRMRNPNARS